MKSMKRLLAIGLAAVMTAALSLTAMGASITIKQDKTYDENMATGTAKYTYYKVFDASYSKNRLENTQGAKDTFTQTPEDAPVAYSLDKDDPWVTALATFNESDKTYTPVAGQKWFELKLAGDGTTVIVKATKDMKDAESAKAAAAWLLENKPDGINGTEISASNGQAATGEIADGYYLIESNVGGNLVLATTDLVIVEKNAYPGVKKTASDADLSAQIGKPVQFTLTVDVPAGSNQQIVLTDTMSDGLSFVRIDSVQADGKDVAYTLDPKEPGEDDKTFTVTFKKDTVTALVADKEAKKIEIIYTARVNKAAVVGTASNAEDGNENEIVLKYGNEFVSVPDKVYIDTQSFKLLKYDSEDETKTPIKGAVFELRLEGTALELVKEKDTVYRIADEDEDEEVVTEIITVDGTAITIKGVDGDVEYTLVETAAPEGYNKLAEPLTIIPDKENTAVVEAENSKGVVLPSTGGTGTTIFYVLGSILVIGAGIVLVAKRRMGEK